MGGIEKLKEYNYILKMRLQDRHLITVQELLEIKDHIESCDRRVETNFEKILVLESAFHFERYYRFWCNHKSLTERNRVRQLAIITQSNGIKKEPPKPEETKALVKRSPSEDNPAQHHKNLKITSNDRRFLKSLGIAVDDPRSDEDPEC